jgi:transcriptional regulator with XRE-family HTH domain
VNKDDIPLREDLEKAVKVAYGALLKEVRTNRKGGKISQESLAYESQYDRTYIHKLENSTYQPSLSAFILLSYHLGISPNKMLRSVLDEIEKH